jgi:hypothetical protein
MSYLVRTLTGQDSAPKQVAQQVAKAVAPTEATRAEKVSASQARARRVASRSLLGEGRFDLAGETRRTLGVG